ncbi:MAG TPA: DUF4332 domain-containing protein [Clostridiales bacterium]|nr:DUF4332 domain-containing protein [Clostridiales bacterium]
MAKLSEIEGIGKLFTEKLKEAGISSQEDLLAACATKDARSELSEKSDISEKLLLKWANRADLARIKGIGGEYADLLEMAGVDTVPELAKRRMDNLYAKIAEINSTQKLVRKLPTEKQVGEWIRHAAELPRMLKY